MRCASRSPLGDENERASETGPGYARAVSTLIERIEEVVHVRGAEDRSFTERQWLLRAGLSHSVFSYLRSRVAANPEAELERKSYSALAKVAGVNVEWLRFGRGPRDLSPGSPPPHDDDATPASVREPGDEGPTTGASATKGSGHEVVVRLHAGRVPALLTFGALASWPAIVAGARSLRPGHPEWVWEHVGRTPLFVSTAPSPGMVAGVADLVLAFETAPSGE